MSIISPAENHTHKVLNGYISEKEYARQRGVSIRTCQRDRALRKSPPHVIYGKTIYYNVNSVRSWLVSQERNPLQSRSSRSAV